MKRKIDMGQPTRGETVHAQVFDFMRGQILMRPDMQDATAKTINEIAKMAASQAKMYIDQRDS